MASLAGKKGTKAIAGSSKLVGINYNKVNGLKYQNYTAMDTINRYGELMNSGGWMSADDLAKYKSAIDTYTTTGNSLRKLGKYTAEEDQSWLDAITSLNSGYEGATKFYSQFENENIYDYFASPYKSDFAENSKYVTTKYGDPHLNIWSNMYDDTGFGDVEYDYINKNEDAASIKFVNSQVNGYNPNGASNSQRLEMTDEEIAVFNYLYKTKGKDAAYAYTDYLKSDLNARQRQTIQDQWSAYAEANPVESSIFSVLISPLKGTAYIAQAADYLKTGSIDQNAIYNKDLFISGAIRDTVSNQVKSKWGDVGSFAYQTGMSMGDFLFNTAITGGNQTLSLALMGTGAAADTVMAAKDRGLDDTQAFLEGTIAGAIEIVCEKIGMDALFDAALAGKDALTYVVKNALAEGGEELLSSVVNFVADLAIARDKSEFAQDVQANGWGNALLNQGLSFAADALGGAISGGVLGSFGAGIGAINTSSQGSQIKRDGYEYKNFAYVANAVAKSNFTQRMVDNVAKGKDLTNYQVGKLYGNTLEGGRNAITNAFEKRLTELKSKDAKAVAEALTKESLGEELSKKERNLLDNSKEVIVVRAEGMVEKARGNVDLGISSPKIMTSKDENEKAETVNAENSGKRVEAVETIAADKLAGNKINQEASEAMVKGYDGKVSASEYSKLYQAAYDAGASGKAQSSLSELINLGLSQQTAFAAYDIGKNSVLKSDAEGGIINTESAEAKNEGGEGVHLRGSVQRNNGENTQGQLSGVEKDSGKTGGGRDSSRSPADEAAARLVHEGREVTVADLGIPGGSKSQKIYRLEGVEDTAKMKKARKAAEKRGLVVRFFAGDNLMIETKDGTIENVRGYIQGKYVYIRADHPYYTADQIMRHELGHDMVAKGEVSIKKVIKRLTELVGEENVEAVLEHYAAAYAGTGLTVDEVWEEVICDSLGDMNIFAGDKVISEFMAPVLKDIKQAVSETKGEANKTRGAPTSNVLYNKRSGKNGWGKKYNTAQEALNAAVEDLNGELWQAFNKEVENAVDTKNPDMPITDALVAVQEDVRQDTITPIQGAKLLDEAYKTNGVNGLRSIVNRRNGNLYDRYLEHAKKYDTKPAEAEGKASREIKENNIGERYGKETENSRVLANGRETAAVGGSKNNQRKQGYDSANSSTPMANDGVGSKRDAGKSGYDGKTTSWLGRNRFVSQSSFNRFRETLLRNRAGLSSTDITGKAVPSDVLQKFKDTMFTDENGSLLVLYHWTPNKFLVFAKGDTGFHFGVYEAAYDRRGSKNEKELGADIVKAVYLNIKNPILLQDEFAWDAQEIALQLWEKGLITLEERLKISKMRGYYDGDYDSQASVYVRKLLEDFGYDGIIYENAVEGKGTLSAVALYPGQIYTVAEETVSGNKGKASRELDSLGNELSPAVQKRFEKSTVVDENGRLKVVYHGTTSGEFYTFDKSKGSVEGDFGSGFYFTDNLDDVSNNYEGGGPDFENKVWRRAEQIFDEDPDIQMDEAKDKARAELYKGSNKFEVYLNVENPAIVGETILFAPESYAENYNEEDYDNYDDYIGDVEQLLADDIDSIIWDIENSIDLYGSTDGIRNVLIEAYYEGGIDIEKLKSKINELYLESTDGEIVGNEVTRQIIESLGYDGIVDSTVSSKFKNMGMEADTTHYIVFKPNQIKAVTNQNPTDNPDIRYSRELDLIDYINENGDGEITAKNKPLTNREILAGALESAVKSEKELEKLQEYKKNIKELNKKAYVLSKMKEDIKRLSFGKGNKDVAKIAELKEKAAKIERSINYYDRQLTNLEAMKPIQDLLQREKQKAYQRAAEKGREALKRNVEGRHKTAERNAIRKDAKDLEKLLNRGTKDRNIKEGEQDLVRRLLEITDLLFASDDELLLNGISTQYTAAEAVAMDAYMKLYEEYHSYDNAVTENKEKRANLRSQMNDLKKSFEGVLERERQRLNDVKAVTAFDALIKEYEGLKNSELNYIKDAYDSDIAEHLKALKESLGTTTIADMTLEQLETLHKAVTMVKTTIQNSNKLFKDNGKSVEDLGNEARIEIESKGRKDKITEAGKTVSKISWNNLKPVYLLERTGSKVLQKLGQAILDGESKWARIMSRARGFANEVKAKHGYKSWDLNKTHQFSNEFGQTFKVTTGQIMSIYAYSKRGEQALNHLRTDGFVMDKLKVKERNKIGIPIEYELNDKTAYKVSDVTLMEMLSKLTPEQKAYVDEMQKYLSEDMGNLGNEISMQLYGIKMFGEENYFPIHSSGSYLERVRQQQKGEAKIKNKGFTKPTQPNASNAIVLTPFNDVWSEHVSEMASYNAFTLPMEDFYKVYNYQTKSGAESVKRGVIPALENAYGEAAVNAIDQLLNDLNGGARTDAVEFEFKKLLTQFKRAKTLLSLSVVVQQPSAAIRAQAMIDPKFFVGKKIGEAKSKELWEEIKQYAPVAIIKEMGHFDVGMGRSSASWLMAEEYEGFAENVKGFVTDEDFRGDVLGYLPAKADEMAWATIWNAVKRETASNNPQLNTSSKEFLEIAGARFEDVIRHTQVYDSTLAKSANMRSKSTLMQMEMAFMAEPTTSMNMLEMALRSGKKSTILRVAGAVYASYLLNAILVALPYAMRDDDEDETFGEKYISALASSFLDNANPLASLPFLKDVWSLLQGYSIERTDMSLIEDALSTMRKIFKAAVNGEVDADAILNLAGSLSAFTGLPVANVIRDIKSIVNAGKTITREVEGMSTTWGSILDELQETAHSETPILSWMPKESKSDKLYDAIMRGDKAYIDRLRNSYSDFSAYKSAVRKALRDNDPRVKEAADAKNRGDMKTYEKILNEIAKENHFAADLIEGAIEAEANAIYNDFKESDERIVQAAMAMMLGDDKQRIAVEKEIVAEGQFTYDLVQKARKSETTNVTNLLKEAKEYVKAGRYEDAQVIYNELINRGYTQAFIDAYLKKIN